MHSLNAQMNMTLNLKKKKSGPSLVVRWLRICLAIQGTQVPLVPGWGTKIPHALEQLSPGATATKARTSQLES